MMIFVLKPLRYLVVLIILLSSQLTSAAQDKIIDLQIMETKLYYFDSAKSDTSKKSEYRTYRNGDNWSKLKNMTLRVKLVNNGKDTAIAVKVIPELYFLFKGKVGGHPFPSISNSDPNNKELKDILNKNNVWVWNKNLGSKGKKYLKRGAILELQFDNLDISNPYYAMNYTIAAFAVRVYAFSNRKDSRYSDNAVDLIYTYPM